MADVSEGLTFEGEDSSSDPNSQEGFDSLLAEKVSAGMPVEEQPDPEEIIYATPNVVVGQILEGGPNAGNSVSDGLTYGDDRKQAQERPSLSPENTELVSQASERIEAMEDELADHRQLDAEAAAWGVLEDFYDPEKNVDEIQRIQAWADLDAKIKLLAIHDGLVEVEDAKQLEAAAEAMLGIEESELATGQLASKYEGEYNDKVRRIESWAKENVLSKSQAAARYADAIALAKSRGLGHVFDARAVNVSPVEFENHLRVVDALAVEAGSLERQAAFKQALLAGDKSVSAGLTLGGMPLNPPLGPTPQQLEAQARDRNDRILSRATKRVMTGKQFKEALLQNPKDVRSGLTMNGSPMYE